MAIEALAKGGWLDPELVENGARQVGRRLRPAQVKQSTAATPYGPVMQKMQLPSDDLPAWNDCHSLALIFYLSTISEAFSSMMASSTLAGVAMRLALYIDELCLGSPLRTDKSRTLQAIYWCFVDWPDHVLCRTAARAVSGRVRAKPVETRPRGGYYLMVAVGGTTGTAPGRG